MTSIIKAGLILVDAFILFMMLFFLAVFVGMLYMACHYAKANRKETDAYERKSNRENGGISLMLAGGSLVIVILLTRGAVWIMELI